MKNDILIYFILIFFLLIKNKSFEKFSSDTNISELNKNIKNSFPKIGNLKMASLPQGTILPFADKKENIPEGWKECDGTNGTPNLKGRFLFGKGYSLGNIHNKPMNYYSRKYDDELNNSVDGNSITQTKYDHLKILESNLPKHTHTGKTNNDGSHNHSFRKMKSLIANTAILNNDKWFYFKYLGGTTESTNHSHEFTTDETGGGEPIELMPPWYAIIYIIKLY